jgi:hypothetical protein
VGVIQKRGSQSQKISKILKKQSTGNSRKEVMMSDKSQKRSVRRFAEWYFNESHEGIFLPTLFLFSAFTLYLAMRIATL